MTLVVLPSRRGSGCLRGTILAPSETSECYKRFATPRYGHPYRDFYYNVTYESIAYVAQNWDAHHIAISHLSGCGSFHEDIATCNAEALAHYCDANPAAIESFVFLGDAGGISLDHLAGIRRLNAETNSGRHRAIATETEHRGGHVLVHLDWRHDA